MDSPLTVFCGSSFPHGEHAWNNPLREVVYVCFGVSVGGLVRTKSEIAEQPKPKEWTKLVPGSLQMPVMKPSVQEELNLSWMKIENKIAEAVKEADDAALDYATKVAEAIGISIEELGETYYLEYENVNTSSYDHPFSNEYQFVIKTKFRLKRRE